MATASSIEMQCEMLEDKIFGIIDQEMKAMRERLQISIHSLVRSTSQASSISAACPGALRCSQTWRLPAKSGVGNQGAACCSAPTAPDYNYTHWPQQLDDRVGQYGQLPEMLMPRELDDRTGHYGSLSETVCAKSHSELSPEARRLSHSGLLHPPTSSTSVAVCESKGDVAYIEEESASERPGLIFEPIRDGISFERDYLEASSPDSMQLITDISLKDEPYPAGRRMNDISETSTADAVATPKEKAGADQDGLAAPLGKAATIGLAGSSSSTGKLFAGEETTGFHQSNLPIETTSAWHRSSTQQDLERHLKSSESEKEASETSGRENPISGPSRTRGRWKQALASVSGLSVGRVTSLAQKAAGTSIKSPASKSPGLRWKKALNRVKIINTLTAAPTESFKTNSEKLLEYRSQLTNQEDEANDAKEEEKRISLRKSLMSVFEGGERRKVAAARFKQAGDRTIVNNRANNRARTTSEEYQAFQLQRLADRPKGVRGWWRDLRDEISVAWLIIEPHLPKSLVFQPSSTAKKYWDYLLFILLLYISYAVPYKIAFFETDEKWPIEALEWADVICDYCFALDLLINFNTAYIDNTQTVVTNRYKIAQQYIRTWFCLDLMCASTLLLQSGETELLQMGKVLRLLRLGKMVKKLTKTSEGTDGVNPRMQSIITLCLCVTMLLHVLSCATHAMRMADANYEWLDLDEETKDDGDLDHYLQAFYWTTFTMAGNSTIPVSQATSLYTICIFWTGMVLNGILMGNLLALISNSDMAQADFRMKLERVLLYMRKLEMPVGLRRRILAFMNTNHTMNNGVDTQQFLEELPRQLQQEVATYINRTVVDAVPFLTDFALPFQAALISRLVSRFYTGGTYICMESDSATEVYFLVKGEVAVWKNRKKLCTIYEGQIFGETALRDHESRSATCVAITHCHCYAIARETFHEIQELMPEEAKKFYDAALSFHQSGSKYSIAGIVQLAQRSKRLGKQKAK
ncbi:hypothetical protein CYMTET_21796 [Cymbomonas tetramitiformis]|uniref:Cyclic nucleotide-binding domain-containing protein n=1 Tax=Cymbomonas tetramitiformis TaxID=36881 RepID=A0AAE0G1B5_9CHLO|nr:hypothetical protein CYMTET_21796 [Cymbomonas tetramitiformis]